MMQAAAHSLHAETSNATSAQSGLSTGDHVDTTTDNTTCEQHSNTRDADSASSVQPPVDCSKTTQQLIG